VPRGSRPLRLEVGADGFAPVAHHGIPDRDRAVEVALLRPSGGAPPGRPGSSMSPARAGTTAVGGIGSPSDPTARPRASW
jgi:hypothetical protein